LLPAAYESTSLTKYLVSTECYHFNKRLLKSIYFDLHFIISEIKYFSCFLISNIATLCASTVYVQYLHCFFLTIYRNSLCTKILLLQIFFQFLVLLMTPL
jgi:hypothetical protein